MSQKASLQAAVRFDRIVEIHKPAQFLAPVLRIVKCLLTVPHLQQRPNHTFRFAVGLRTRNTGKLLHDVVASAGSAKRVGCIAFVLHSVVRVRAFDSVRTAVNHVVQQELGGTGSRTVG